MKEGRKEGKGAVFGVKAYISCANALLTCFRRPVNPLSPSLPRLFFSPHPRITPSLPSPLSPTFPCEATLGPAVILDTRIMEVAWATELGEVREPGSNRMVWCMRDACCVLRFIVR